MNALEGIRVLDFGRYVAGPYCATLLAEFGADVLRIEKRGSNDDRYVTPVTSEGEGALFLLMARNKRSLSLDPVSEEGRKVVRRLVANSDIVVVNMSPRALVSLGLDYATLSEINPRIILVSVTAFGDEGPWKDRLGFDTIGQAMSGTTYLCGTEQQPYRSPASWVDFTTGIYGAFGALAALRERDRSGRGQMVSANLLASALMSNGLTVLEQALTSPNRKAIGNRNFGSGPTDLFRVKDGWLQVHVIGSALFARWARLMGEEAKWVSDPRFATDDLRGRNGAILSERMAEWCSQRTREEAIAALSEAKVPAAPVLSPQEAFNHPQVQAMGLFEAVAYPGLDKPAPLQRAPVELSRTPGSISRPPPTVGQQTDEVRARVGYSPEDIAELRERGVI